MMVVIAATPTTVARAQSGAQALFWSVSTLAVDPFGNPWGPVGIRYWFESARGERFLSANDAKPGTVLRLHVASNVSGFLVVWRIDDSGNGSMLTPLHGGFAGHPMQAPLEYAVADDVTVPSKGAMVVLFARSQTEQVRTATEAQEKIQRLSRAAARDGAPAVVQETDTGVSERRGTYVVHREGAQPGAVIPLGP